MSLLDVVPVIPVVVVHDAADAVPIAKALVDGGLPVIELTLRTPAALESIKRIANQAMRDSGLPYLPGVSTVSEVLTLLECGQSEMKFFPAEQAGGAPYLRAIQSPVPAARFCPTGGITPANMGTYLASPNVGCVGGSWLTPADVVARQDWDTIAHLARTARELAAPR